VTTTKSKQIKNLIELVQLVDGVIEGLLGDLARLILELWGDGGGDGDEDRVIENGVAVVVQ
jgi:hypothetical protein